jgi:hypothetical protein
MGSWLRSSALASVAALPFVLAGAADAALVTYSYTGNVWTQTALFEPGSRLIGTFTANLPDDYANLPFADRSAAITSYTFYSADSCCWNITYSGTSSGNHAFDFFRFSTDAAGNILEWSIWATDFTTEFGFVTTSVSISNPPAPVYDGAFDYLNRVINGSPRPSTVLGDPGQWQASGPPPVGAPEPSLPLLGLAALGALAWPARRSAVAARKALGRAPTQ